MGRPEWPKSASTSVTMTQKRPEAQKNTRLFKLYAAHTSSTRAAGAERHRLPRTPAPHPHKTRHQACTQPRIQCCKSSKSLGVWVVETPKQSVDRASRKTKDRAQEGTQTRHGKQPQTHHTLTAPGCARHVRRRPTDLPPPAHSAHTRESRRERGAFCGDMWTTRRLSRRPQCLGPARFL